MYFLALHKETPEGTGISLQIEALSLVAASYFLL